VTDQTSRALADAVIAEFAERRNAWLQRKAHRAPATHPHASAIDKCTRAMVYDITRGEQKPAFNLETTARVERGTKLEKRIIGPMLAEMGMESIGQQAFCQVRNSQGDLLCTGHVDTFLLYEGLIIPTDIKTAHPYRWHRFNTAQDFFDDDWAWRYPLQLMVYMHAYSTTPGSVPFGFILLDDCLGHVKDPIPIFYDEDLANKIMDRCQQALYHARDHTLPDFYSDPAHCTRCDWHKCGVCAPPMNYEAVGGVKVISSEELEQALLDRETSEPGKRAFDAAERIIGQTVKRCEPGTYLCGPFRIDIVEQSRAAYAVPASSFNKKKIDRFIVLAKDSELGSRIDEVA